MLDIEQSDALIAYLQDRGWAQPAAPPVVRTLEGGVSNRTVLVEFADGRAWVLKQALEKLRVAVDWFSSPQRIHREALGLRWLPQLAPPDSTPALVFEDEQQHILAMTAVPQPHHNWKRLLLAGQVQPDHIRQFARLLAAIHGGAWLRRDEIASVFAEYHFFENLRLEPYYSYTAAQVSEAATFLHALAEETRAHRLTLVHGDYSPKNILVYQDRLILLDHEVIHWGDPAFDVGFSLAHLLSKAHHLKPQRAAFADAARLYWQEYMRALVDVDWRAGLEARVARQTLACLLARVAGRSPLEYLDSEARARQRGVVVRLIQTPPDQIGSLIDHFIEGLNHAND